MKLYRAYGLVLACEWELPFGAAESGAAADIIILEKLGQPPRRPANEVLRELYREGQSWSLRYTNPEGGWLHFDYDAFAKTLTVPGSVGWNDAVPVLVGVACAVLLSSTGTPLLHGAAVAFGGGAIALLGASGRGKSTLAAGLIRAGGRLLSEDLLVISGRGEAFEVDPGYARISLLPDSCEMLGCSSSDVPQPRSGTGKSWLKAVAASGPVPIRRLYVLAAPDPAVPQGRVERLPRCGAAAALVQELYGVPWIRPVSGSDLTLCGRLAAQVPVFRLSRPLTLEDVEACSTMLRYPSRR